MRFPESELAAIVDAAIALGAMVACWFALFAIVAALSDTQLSGVECVETQDVEHCYRRAER